MHTKLNWFSIVETYTSTNKHKAAKNTKKTGGKLFAVVFWLMLLQSPISCGPLGCKNFLHEGRFVSKNAKKNQIKSYKPGFGFGLSEKGGRGWAKENFAQERKHVDISHVDISHEMRTTLDETMKKSSIDFT